MYLVGGSVGFYSGNIKFLVEDMKVLKPTIMPSVPRLLNRIYEKEMANIVPWFFKRTMFNMALRSKQNEIKKFGLSPTSVIVRIIMLLYLDTRVSEV
jgi:long-chain acyl-CoA synthetase